MFHLTGLSSVYDAVKMQHLLLRIGQRKRRFKFFRLNTACKWLEIADVEESGVASYTRSVWDLGLVGAQNVRQLQNPGQPTEDWQYY